MISETQNVLLKILASSLFQKEYSSVSNVNWDSLLKEAEQQAVYSLVFSEIKTVLKQEISSGRYRYYEELFLKNCYITERNIYDHKWIHELLSQNSIPYVIIKGQASAAYYPQPKLRATGDVDFLVKKDFLDETGRLLEEHGFRRTTDTEHGFHIAYYSEATVYEMHWRPNGVPDGKKGELCYEYLRDVQTNAHEYNQMLVPGDFEHGLIILLHTVSHMINAGIGLRHLCDWAVYVNAVDVNAYRQKLQAIGLWRFAQLLTQVATRYLGCPIQSWAMERYDDKLLSSIMEDILAGGEFGMKDVERLNEAKFMTTRATMTVEGGGTLKHFCYMMNENARLAMPACNKYSVLLPLGWIYAAGRYVFLMRKGRRPLFHIKKTMNGVRTRLDIYKAFELYK